MTLNKNGKAHAVILAAGEARRAGGPKIIWPIEGVPSVRKVAMTALKTKNIASLTVISGAWRQQLQQALEGLELTIIHNDDFSSGQSSSVVKAVRFINKRSGSLLFLTADQPFITSQMLFDLIEFHFNCGAVLSAPFFKGQRRNPIVFSLEHWFDDLLALKGDEGGRVIVKANQDKVALWPADHLDPKVFCDFDTPEEYERLQL